jgi:hypothetical protein
MSVTTITNRFGEPRIAVVSFDSLGDSLIYLMMADNLRRNGFEVTHYGDIAYQMREWFPQLDIRPYPFPTIEKMETELDGYDLAIVSPPSFIRSHMDEASTVRLRKQWLLICQKSPDTWYFDHTERLRHKHPARIIATIEQLLAGISNDG